VPAENSLEAIDPQLVFWAKARYKIHSKRKFMMCTKLTAFSKSIAIGSLLLGPLPTACKSDPKATTDSQDTAAPTETTAEFTPAATTTTPNNSNTNTATGTEEMPAATITQELLDLEAAYPNELDQIISLKATQPKIYWFIVSWLKIEYQTPDWTGYTTDNYDA
jgi:cytoskeletal protein RodZ